MSDRRPSIRRRSQLVAGLFTTALVLGGCSDDEAPLLDRAAFPRIQEQFTDRGTLTALVCNELGVGIARFRPVAKAEVRFQLDDTTWVGASLFDANLSPQDFDERVSGLEEEAQDCTVGGPAHTPGSTLSAIPGLPASTVGWRSTYQGNISETVLTHLADGNVLAVGTQFQGEAPIEIVELLDIARQGAATLASTSRGRA